MSLPLPGFLGQKTPAGGYDAETSAELTQRHEAADPPDAPLVRHEVRLSDRVIVARRRPDRNPREEERVPLAQVRRRPQQGVARGAAAGVLERVDHRVC